jgi:uncharacterized protein (TIGR02594 family)
MSSISRRRFGAMALGGVLPPLRDATAKYGIEPMLSPPPLPKQYESLANEDSMNEEFGDVTLMTGTLQPSSDEKDVGNQIIAAVEKLNKRPIDVAQFLFDIARGNHGPTWQPYTRAWPKDAHANPLIVDFFNATQLKPMGDTTAWCAAFVNWCIKKSAGSTATNSAASASFINWGTVVGTFDPQSSSLVLNIPPRLGDVVVFQDVLSGGQLDPNHGHVAFYVEHDSQRIMVLGGNQFEGQPVVHAINAKWFLMTGSPRLYSIRRSEVL